MKVRVLGLIKESQLEEEIEKYRPFEYKLISITFRNGVGYVAFYDRI